MLLSACFMLSLMNLLFSQVVWICVVVEVQYRTLQKESQQFWSNVLILIQIGYPEYH